MKAFLSTFIETFIRKKNTFSSALPREILELVYPFGKIEHYST